MTNKEDFISTVSHELRTPLTSIRGFAQTMLSSWDKIDDQNKKKFVSIIEQQSNRLIDLVENILSVSKNSEDSAILKNVNANNVIKAVLQIIEQQFVSHIVSLNLDSTNPHINVDVDKFQQILINLLENAIKYSNKGTKIDISTSHTDKFVLIKIKDEGIGIDDEYKEKIFEKFSRIDSPLTRKTQGSGLGLYITKMLVENMNGEISVHTKEVGTEFEVKFPLYNIEEHVQCSIK